MSSDSKADSAEDDARTSLGSVTTGWWPGAVLRRVHLVWRELAVSRGQVQHEAVRCVAATCLLLAVVMAGAVCLCALEAGHENRVKCALRRHRSRLLDQLWTHADRMDRRSWRVFAHAQLVQHERHMGATAVTTDSERQLWTMSSSAIYTWTIVTTIGYGHLTPATSAGRAVSMLYAMIGIPIFLAVLADYGKLLTRSLKLLLAAAYRLYNTCSCLRLRSPTGQPVEESTQRGGAARESSEPGAAPVIIIDDEFNLPISLALSILVAYIFLGASLFALIEEWSYFEAFYFVFVSMTTIGFGDYVPSSAGVMMATTLYMIFGLALTSMCINVIQERLSQHLRQASIKLGSRFGVTSSPSALQMEVAAVHQKTR